ncbi:hypothetical protein ACTWPW_44460, partial [Nonomuraea sp. KM90]
MTTAALDGIDDIDWGSLEHAYGSAEDVPQTLRDAVGEDDGVAEEAIDELFGSVFHQGTLYGATPWAVPFIARLAADPGTRRRHRLVHLLGAIASTDDAAPEVLEDVSAALARETGRLLPLLDDPDAELRHAATYLLGNLPRESAAEVMPALRARRSRESSPYVLAGLLAAAARLDPPESAAWLTAELTPDRPSAGGDDGRPLEGRWAGGAAEAALDGPSPVRNGESTPDQRAALRAGALWAIADAGLPWPDTTSELLVGYWSNGEQPLKGWVWSGDPFGEIVSHLGGLAFTEVCAALLERGTAEAARAAVDAAYDRGARSRSARAELAPLLAAAVSHPDLTVRTAAVAAVRDLSAAAPATVDILAT